MKKSNISVAIDGPAGAGKSTISKLLADKLNFEYIDTGSMFRAIAFKVSIEGVDIYNLSQLNALIENTTIDFVDGKIFLDGADVSSSIRKPNISAIASEIATNANIRKFLLDIQREIADNKSIVMDGRDIGTVVLPNADYKFFLTASINERANRRFKELNSESDISFEDVKKDMIRRDENDMNREIAPLKKADDALLIDSTNMTLGETVDMMISYMR